MRGFPDATPSARDEPSRMTSYAVILQHEGEPPAAGRLEIGPHALWFHGSNRVGQERLELDHSEIVSAVRDRNIHIGPCRAIRIQSHTLGSFLLASMGGVGILREILESINAIS
jgi:hypothetical protein